MDIVKKSLLFLAIWAILSNGVLLILALNAFIALGFNWPLAVQGIQNQAFQQVGATVIFVTFIVSVLIVIRK